MNNRDTIHLVCGCDDNYAPHAATMLRSARDNLEVSQNITAYILHDSGLSQENISNIRRSVNGMEVRSLPVPDELMQGLPTNNFHKACWHRIFIPDLLPAVSRVIYLDSDMVVVDDLTPLWHESLDGHAFGAAINPLYPFQPPYPQNRLGLRDRADYLNSGCLVMDLTRLRSERFSAKIKEYAMAHPQNWWPEQDAISVLYEGRWKKLHPRWNAQNTLFDLPPKKLPFAHTLAIEAIKNPAVVHFIGPRKPWTYLAKHPYKKHYHRYRAQTQWKQWQYTDKTPFNILIRHLPLAVQLKLERLKAKLSTKRYATETQ